MSENYSKRELDYHFAEMKTTLSEIKSQVLKTNGRVSALEKWRWVITGGLIAVGAMGVPNISQVVQAFSGK